MGSGVDEPKVFGIADFLSGPILKEVVIEVAGVGPTRFTEMSGTRFSVMLEQMNAEKGEFKYQSWLLEMLGKEVDEADVEEVFAKLEANTSQKQLLELWGAGLALNGLSNTALEDAEKK